MNKCGWCGGTGRVGSKFLDEPCPSCDGTGMVMDQKIDGLKITCGEKSLWVSREVVEDLLSGKSSGVGRLTSPIGIIVIPNVVKI